MNTTTNVIISESGTRSDQPDFRQIGNRWIFNGCTYPSGFPTRETAEKAHAITWQLRDLPRDENRKLNRADAKLAKALWLQLEELRQPTPYPYYLPNVRPCDRMAS